MKRGKILFPFFLASPALADGWLPEAASQAARSVDRDFLFLVTLVGLILVTVFFAFDLLLLMYLRRGDNEVGQAAISGRRGRSLVALLAAVLGIGLFVTGARGYLDQRVAPTDALEIEARFGEEALSFHYSGDVEAESLHVPADRPVVLKLSSEDSIASLAIPAFRLRRATRPGLSTEAWFQAEKPGEYALTSSGASLGATPGAASTVTVHSSPDFDSWLESKSDVLLMFPPAEAGRMLIERKGCLVCHTTDGSRLTGPSFLGILGRESVMADGSTLTVDDAYVRQSIREPAAQVVEGFEPVMPAFAGQIRDEEIDAILTYFQTLSETGEAQ